MTWDELPLSQRLGMILAGLCRGLAARGGRDRWDPAIVDRVELAYLYVSRLRLRLLSLLRRIEAGVPKRPSRPRAEPAVSDPPTPRRIRPKLPRGQGWMRQLALEGAGYSSQLTHQLQQPEMVALLEADPRVSRLLRPLCRALGIEPHPHIPAVLLPPKPPKPPRVPAPRRVLPPRVLPPRVWHPVVGWWRPKRPAPA